MNEPPGFPYSTPLVIANRLFLVGYYADAYNKCEAIRLNASTTTTAPLCHPLSADALFLEDDLEVTFFYKLQAAALQRAFGRVEVQLDVEEKLTKVETLLSEAKTVVTDRAPQLSTIMPGWIEVINEDLEHVKQTRQLLKQAIADAAAATPAPASALVTSTTLDPVDGASVVHGGVLSSNVENILGLYLAVYKEDEEEDDDEEIEDDEEESEGEGEPEEGEEYEIESEEVDEGKKEQEDHQDSDLVDSDGNKNNHGIMASEGNEARAVSSERSGKLGDSEEQVSSAEGASDYHEEANPLMYTDDLDAWEIPLPDLMEEGELEGTDADDSESDEDDPEAAEAAGSTITISSPRPAMDPTTMEGVASSSIQRLRVKDDESIDDGDQEDAEDSEAKKA